MRFLMKIVQVLVVIGVLTACGSGSEDVMVRGYTDEEDTSTITLHLSAKASQEDLQVQVTETNDSVFLKVSEPTRRGPDNNSLNSYKIEITLNEPVGDREVIDKSTDTVVEYGGRTEP